MYAPLALVSSTFSADQSSSRLARGGCEGHKDSSQAESLELAAAAVRLPRAEEELDAALAEEERKLREKSAAALADANGGARLQARSGAESSKGQDESEKLPGGRRESKLDAEVLLRGLTSQVG